jgi:Patatin-like phospholipase
MKVILAMSVFSSMFNKIFSTRVVGITNIIPKPVLFAELNSEQCVVNLKTNKWICSDNALYLKENEFIKEKKLISISPGGFKGFYMLGTCAFIKENYILDDYIYSGASAGAWNALFMTYKKDPLELAYELLDKKLNDAISIIDLEYMIKYKIVNNYKTDDFNLNRLFIGVTSFESMKIKTHIFSEFETLEDAVNCCIASSHIPYITGNNFLNKYRNMNVFDGGFSKYPYLNIIKPSLHITPGMWKNINESNNFNGEEFTAKKYFEKLLKMQTQVSDYTTLFSRGKYDFADLYDNGHRDAKNNREALDKIFTK